MVKLTHILGTILLIGFTAIRLPSEGLPRWQSEDDALRQAIQRFADQSGGVVGVTAIHVETGRRISVNGAVRFPMASVFKLPVALQLMRRVENREIRLNDSVTLSTKDFREGNSPLADMARDTPVTFTVERLLVWMLAEGDNSATDALLRLAGGPGAVTANLRSMGVDDINVDRSEAEMFFDIMGIRERPPEHEWSRSVLASLANKVPIEERRVALSRYADDPRDTASPAATADLLVKLQTGKVGLGAGSVRRLLDVMTSSTTGPERLKGLLPVGTPVAHKTGSAAGSRNDVGLIALPNSDHIAIAVFIKSSAKDDATRDRTIAEIARTVYDYFVLLDSRPH